MDLLLLLLYAGFATAIFKIFKIPLNKYTVPTAILGGVLFLFTLLFWMNFKHPYAKYAKELFISVPIIPDVSGTVVDVPVEPNEPLKEGDVLFKIDPRPYELEVKRLEAQLKGAEQDVKELEAAQDTAQARVDAAEAERDRTKQEFERTEGAAPGAVSERDINTRKGYFLANEADLRAARSELVQIELNIGSRIDGKDTRVLEIEAQLEKARYDLERTVVRAPSDGIVTQVALRKGSRAVNLPLRPAMVFIPSERRRIVASFWQNSLRNIEEGQPAEVIFAAAPGKIFPGKVSKVLPVIPEAEIQYGGTLISGDLIEHHDRTLAIIDLEQDLNDLNLPIGVQGQAACFTEHDALHSSPVRRILLRMMGWLNYLYPIKK